MTTDPHIVPGPPPKIDRTTTARLRNGTYHPFVEVDALWRALRLTLEQFPDLLHGLRSLATGQPVAERMASRLEAEGFLTPGGILQPIVRDTLASSFTTAANGEGWILRDPICTDETVTPDSLAVREKRRAAALLELADRLVKDGPATEQVGERRP